MSTRVRWSLSLALVGAAACGEDDDGSTPEQSTSASATEGSSGTAAPGSATESGSTAGSERETEGDMVAICRFACLQPVDCCALAIDPGACEQGLGTFPYAYGCDGTCIVDACESDAECQDLAPGTVCDGTFCIEFSCETDEDCPDPARCSGSSADGASFCEFPPACERDADCDEGELCLDGECFPLCSADEDCDDGLSCID